MNYIEPIISRKMTELNREYLELYYSPEYQAVIKGTKIIRLISEMQWQEVFHILKGCIIRKKLVNKSADVLLAKEKEPTQIETSDCTWGISRLPKVVVYTCIINEYDDLDEPYYINPNIDYVVFTDMEIRPDSVWKRNDISKYEQLKGMTPTGKNRYIKLHPHEFFSNYDISIYVDGTVLIMGDMMPIALNLGKKFFGVHKHVYRDCIYMEAKGVLYSKRADADAVKRQIKEYRRDGYPKHAGLYENTILVRQHNQTACVKLMKTWWDEYRKHPTRDQISLPYAMWRCQIEEKDIYILGNSIEKNYRFRRKREHKCCK